MTGQAPVNNEAPPATGMRWRSLLLPSDLIRYGIAALIAGGIYFIYHFQGVTDIGYDVHRTTRSAFYWLFDRWRMDWRDTSFAHSHWVPLITIWLIWRDRRTLMALPKKTNFLGLGVVILALLLHWAGAKSEQTRLSIASLAVLFWGIPFFIYGWPTARRLIFPCGFLVFSLPLNFFDAAAYPLRTLAAYMTSGLLNGLGLEVTRIGSAIRSSAPDGLIVDLADSRSGIFAVMAVFSFSLLCAYLIRTSWLRRAGLVGISIPLLVIANIARGVLAIMMAELFGSSAGQAVLRYLSGPILIIVAFGGVALLAYRLHAPSPTIARVATIASSHHTAITPWALTLLIVALTAWRLPDNLSVVFIEDAGVNLDIPEHLDVWNGGTVLFCHNPADGSHFVDANLHEGDPCPRCSQPLYAMSPVERALLPADTVLQKRRYQDANDTSVFFTIVLSGEKRSSIHRPEVCLVGQGSEIAQTFIHTIALTNGHHLKVKILEMIHRGKNKEGQMVSYATYYAYWFAGIDRETPHHLQRMIWMASDRLFRNKSYRWAYISLSGIRAPGSTDYLAEIDDFIREAYPHLNLR